MRNYCSLTTMILIIATLFGCGGSSNLDKDVTINFRDVPLNTEEINALQPGTTVFVVADRERGIDFRPVQLGNRYTAGSVDFVTILDNRREFGSGDSGSPVVTADGRTIGALSGTFGGNNITVTPIDRMINNITRSPESTATNNKLVWIASGFSDASKQKLRKLGLRVPTVSPSLETPISRSRADQLEAGRSLAVMYVDGELLNLFVVGSVTHAKNESELLALGHYNHWSGRLEQPMPVRLARVVQFVNDQELGGFKLAVPVGEVQAGVTADRMDGILVDRNVAVDRMELSVVANDKHTTHYFSRVDNAPFGLKSQLFMLGVEEIVTLIYDSLNVGEFTVEVSITSDGENRVVELGPYNWTITSRDGNLGYDVWSQIYSEIDQTEKVEIRVLK